MPGGLEVTVGRREWRGAALLATLVLVTTASTAGDTGASPPGDAAQGEVLYRQYCAVCHGATGQGDGPNAASMEDDRPRDLTDAQYMARLTDAQLVEAIRRGGGAVGRSRFMPAWGNTFSSEQIADLILFARTLSRNPPPPARAVAEPPELAGARLVTELGCTGCHRIGDLPAPPVAPDLSNVGAKLQRDWLETFLRQPHRTRPAGYVPLSRSRMPDFRLSTEEARRLAAYLIRLQSPGVPVDGLPVASAGTGGAVASVEGDGSRLFQGLACRACHAFDGRGGQSGPDLSAVRRRLQASWVARYLLDPQAIDPRSPMPRPGITPGDAWALTTYLLGGTETLSASMPSESEEAASGATLFRELACRGCHRRPDEDPSERVAPDLTFVGDKLRPEWLAAFLRHPRPIRAWLPARMPPFGLTDTEIEQVVAFLASLRDAGLTPLPPSLYVTGRTSQATIRAGERLASRDYLSCSSCHLGGDREPERFAEERAPDLRLAGQRLRPDWIVRWLMDPQRLLPGTKMPSYFADAESGPGDILDGDEMWQILAIRDYLLGIATAPAGLGP